MHKLQGYAINSSRCQPVVSDNVIPGTCSFKGRGDILLADGVTNMTHEKFIN